MASLCEIGAPSSAKAQPHARVSREILDTTHSIMQLTSCTTRDTNPGLFLGLILLGPSTAFDAVDYSLILNRLSVLGFSHTTL